MNLRIVELGFAYPNGNQIFTEVNFSLKKGEIFTILGPNGAGKSTLLNCIGNLSEPTQGGIFLEKDNIKDLSLRQFAMRIGYVPQIHQPTYAFTVEEFVAMGRTPYLSAFKKLSLQDQRMIEEAMELVRITDLRNKAYTQLSGGERQLVTIARAIAQEPDFILLDEPTAHLDFGNQIKTMKLVKKLSDQGYGVIMTTHNPDQVFFIGGRVGVLNRSGTFEIGVVDQYLSEDLLSRLYNEPVHLFYSNQLNRNICTAGA
ncbi:MULTISPECIES: ABC transporter ATP-binding protein [unclassified Acetobacterium]|jgi:iron complex transport system ATP-binding protein|uniref:ABC transporter ATP-binding protein n=1 Tax=unclassified Acetobacterium TaxID=2638182 RepID=UPI000DBEBD86|nr:MULTISPECIES: ABC transporter ATP-binding protein [unclassified Acetobacterium]AWW25815.1 ABC transporter ATP-binding protein [Acetobacterium sp. KB-1]MDZ5725866.1 ABC transporter ATP-binding protein [Acetobacterium sp. K1/6]